MNAFDLTVKALREQGLNSDEILEELSQLFQTLTSNKEEASCAETTETKIRELLKKVGAPIHLRGYEYWVVAIKLYKKNGRMSLTKEIYPQVAKICGTTTSRVEKQMRRAVEHVFNRCPADIIYSIFGNTISYEKGKATNREFLVILAQQI